MSNKQNVKDERAGIGAMLLDDATTFPVVLDDGTYRPILSRVPHETMPGLVLDRVAQYRLPVSRTERPY